MNKIEHLIIHCTDTPRELKVTEDTLRQWHTSPRDIKDSKGVITGVYYMNKKYPSRNTLPSDIINGISIKKLHGRGWDRVGYSDKIDRDGITRNLIPYDNDPWVEAGEISFGATGFNQNSRHIVLVGGWLTHEIRNGIFDFTDIFTIEQYNSLKSYILNFLNPWPWCDILGHNQVSNKTCPNFSVPLLMKEMGIPEKNIYQ